MTLSIVASDITSTAGSRSPVADLTGPTYTSATDDIIVMGVRVGNTSAAMTLPSGWGNVLGGNTTVSVTSLTCVLVYHIVTSGEAGSDTFTATNLWDSAQTNAIITWALRDGIAGSPLDQADVASNGSAGTTHTLAALTGASQPDYTGSLVLGFVGGDGTSTYTDPSGWTLDQKNTGGQAQRGGYHRDTLTTAGVDVSSTNITSSGSTRYASITAAFRDPSVPQGNPGQFFLL